MLDILRLTLFQLLHLDRVPASAAVNDAVSLTKRAGKRSAAAEKTLGDRLSAIDDRLAAIDAKFANDFPDYATLSSPTAVAVADVQASLRDDEALILFLDTGAVKSLPEETLRIHSDVVKTLSHNQ